MSCSSIFCRLLLWFVTVCYCKHHSKCVNITVFENTKINISCEDLDISEKECHKDVVFGHYVTPTYRAVRDVQRKCFSERKREVAWNATYDSSTGGYLVLYPEDPSWSASLCKVILVKSDSSFRGTFKTYFQTTSTLFPNVQPLWKIKKEKEWVSSLLITNWVASYLNISFEVQTCKKFNYDVELWKSDGKLYEKKTVTQNFAIFLDIDPGSYFAKIKVSNAGICHCVNSHQCKQYEDWKTDDFIHPSQWRTEKTAERFVPVTLVYAVTTVMVLTFFGVIATVALTIFFKTVSEKCKMIAKMPWSKIMPHQDNITMFHLPKDTAMFYHFIFTRLRKMKNKEIPHIAEKAPNSDKTLSQLHRSLQIIDHSASRLVPEKPRPRALSNQSFDSISQVIAINKRRKYRCTRRMLGFQLTSNGSEHIVLPGHFTYTNEDTATGCDYEGLMVSSADETESDVEQRLWHDTSPKYNTRSADPRKFSLLSDNGLMSDEMEAVSIGGKSV
ncbi:uncharacterized protein [Magallana gigas]|uniref:uncharacterized protein isoform X3 n=1 Tax=Magallana gigas TaxID=29159 RepID=UPI003340D60C